MVETQLGNQLLRKLYFGYRAKHMQSDRDGSSGPRMFIALSVSELSSPLELILPDSGQLEG